MIYSEVLKKEFATKKEMFAELVKEKANIIKTKCAETRKSDNFSIGIVKSTDGVAKGLDANGIEQIKNLSEGDTISVVISAMLNMDSHEDVHSLGMFTKSVEQQQGKIYHVVDHNLMYGSIVAYPDDVKMELKIVDWSELGKPYDGKTEVLVFHTKITDMTNQDVLKAYRNNKGVQHSVRMKYVKVVMCINDEEYKEEYADWLRYIGHVANMDKALEKGYFFYIKEAKIVSEGSSVPFGSNDATPILAYQSTDDIQPIELNVPIIEEIKSENTLTIDEAKSMINNFLTTIKTQ